MKMKIKQNKTEASICQHTPIVGGFDANLAVISCHFKAAWVCRVERSVLDTHLMITFTIELSE